MRSSFALGSLVLCLASHALAQELPLAEPETEGMSAERLQRIHEVVQRSIDDQRIAGMVTMVVRHGKIVWFEAQGMADREAKKPMQKDNLFRICSMTKPITSTAVMMLYEEGKFVLEDPISKYLPEFKNPKVLVKPEKGEPYTIPATREITIADLLTHTSGLTYNWDPTLGQRYAEANVTSGLMPYDGTTADGIKALASQPLLFNPGERWNYSLSVDVLGRLVEVVSGMPFDQFLKTRILGPLGMNDTCFFVDDAQRERLAAAYCYYDGKGLSRFPETPIVEGSFSYSADYPYRGARKYFSGGGGLCSTAHDYARFCQMMLNGGSLGPVRILSRKSVELMTHDELGRIDPDMGFGLGFGVDGVKSPLKELGSPGQYSWGGFFFTSFNIDPKEDMIFIAMGQLHPTGSNMTLLAEAKVAAYQALEN